MIGRLDYPLSKEGRHQALSLGASLEGLNFNLVLTSPLQRAWETAKLIWGPVEPGPTIVEDFAEISLGQWEGLTGKEAEALHPEIWAARGLDMAYTAPPGGESYFQLSERVLPALDLALGDVDDGARLLVVAHRAVNRVILARQQGLGLNDVWQVEQTHCSIIKIEI
jgi:probable phosphoglycerate mutase